MFEFDPLTISLIVTVLLVTFVIGFVVGLLFNKKDDNYFKDDFASYDLSNIDNIHKPQNKNENKLY